MVLNPTRASPKTATSRRKRRRPSRLLLRLLAGSVVLGAGLLLFLYLQVTRRFEGRLWDLPSHVYSARLAIAPGDVLSPDELAARLDRSGYGHAPASGALRPGQYRRNGSVLEIHRRDFESPPSRVPAVRLILRFRGGRVASIRDPRKRSLLRVVFEPELLASFFGPQQEERDVVRLAEVPHGFVQAVLAAEDARFYEHHGVDPVAVVRAALANLRHGRIVQGGSTIPQQTVKNLYLNANRTWWRKLRELPMAVLLDLRYSKDRILEVYLNEVYLGQRGSVAICGAQAAARFYFGRDLKDLSTGEWALLAGLIRNPGGYNPFRHPQAARLRREQVLHALAREGTLDAQRALAAAAEPLHLASGGGGYRRGSYVADLVRSQLEETYTTDVLSQEGMRIYTTVDTLLQERAERALNDGLTRLERDFPTVRRQTARRKLQGSVIALDPRTGAVLALVGGRDYRDTQFNRAVQARRQPGSCFKPFVYLAAFEGAIAGREGGLTPASFLDDAPIAIQAGGKTWRPENYDHLFRGRVTVRRALEQSLNVPAAVAARQAGLSFVVEVAGRCGLPKLQPLPSVALGAQEVTPLELATAYGTLGQGGLRSDARILADVLDGEGRPLERPRARRFRAVGAEAAYLVTDLLRGVVLRGTAASAWSLGFRGTAAGKTGTTDDTRDAWFVGYTPDFLALVWIGYDDSTRTGLTGASGALPIWVDFMRRSGMPGADRFFEAPPGVVRRVIDPETGGLAGDNCPFRVTEVFAKGTQPEEVCSLHGQDGFFDWIRDWFR